MPLYPLRRQGVPAPRTSSKTAVFPQDLAGLSACEVFWGGWFKLRDAKSRHLLAGALIKYLANAPLEGAPTKYFFKLSRGLGRKKVLSSR